MKNVKLIKGYPGYYISKEGKVYSMKAGRRKYKELKPGLVAGYKRVDLCRKGGKKSFLVHRLLLTAFISECPKGMESRHLDGNRLNNSLSNLKWGTRADNGADKVSHGTTCRGESRWSAKLKAKDVLKIREMAKHTKRRKDRVGGEYEKIAKVFGITPENVGRIVRRVTWKHLS